MNDSEINKDSILHAILAMDVYHRGPNSGLKDLSSGTNPITKVGTATLTRNSQDSLESSYGFVAFEYLDSASGKTIYAYRGTDRGFSGDDSLNDRHFGFVTGSGLPNGEQALAALNFFREGNTSADNSVVIGQSLGGGLAGFVSSVFNVEASIYNNMLFDLAAENFLGLLNETKTKEEVSDSINNQFIKIGDGLDAEYVLAGIVALPFFLGLPGAIVQAVIDRALEELDVEELKQQFFEDLDGDGEIDVPDSSNLSSQNNSNVKAFSLEDELLGVLSRQQVFEQNKRQDFETVVDINGVLRQENTPTFFGASEIVTSLSDTLGIEELAERHTSSPLIIRMFGELSDGSGGTIGEDSKEFWSNIWASLYNPDVTSETGISSRRSEFTDRPSEKDFSNHFILHVMLAYSALEANSDGSGLVFGDTGIRSLYNDAADLGKVFDTELDELRSPFLDSTLKFTPGSGPFNSGASILTTKQALADIASQYAGALALNKVVKQEIIDDETLGFDPTQGVFALSNNRGGPRISDQVLRWID